ncbi:hypothetical protein MM213_17335 [Belliella sp. R4-6]|uniref:Uncharacterized protein n=1 Tax=Belliella alkalica TaxID=1730871 RepID=A0ABS9VFP6_9BACT|nr:hypothetical protein [Belliella alkalica]MCH7415267.1 hypothetical protein [Belliella alkalica]
MKNLICIVFLCGLHSCIQLSGNELEGKSQTFYEDEIFLQDYAIKYHYDGKENPKALARERNGNIQVLAETKILSAVNGEFLAPGKLVANNYYLPMSANQIIAISSYDSQVFYLDSQAIFSNGYAGSVYINHQMKNPTAFVVGKYFNFCVAEENRVRLITEGIESWELILPDGQKVLQLKYHPGTNSFWALSIKNLYRLDFEAQKAVSFAMADGFTSFDLDSNGDRVLIGSENGYCEIPLNSSEKEIIWQRKIPWTEITTVSFSAEKLWLGTTKGVFSVSNNKEGTKSEISYYFGERWILGDSVVAINTEKEHEILILTEAGLSKITFEEMTLAQKAQFYEKQVQERHIRYGFNSDLLLYEKGNIHNARLKDSDNDGLWTAMYLGGQAFRYAASKDPEALQNCKESLLAMERLYSINQVPGFPSRSYERSGYISQMSDPERWQHSEIPGWDWKATTSSDEAIGHIFAFGVLAEIVDDSWVKSKSIALIDTLMTHIVENDFYLIDYDQKPTLWGKWNPEYVNGFPEQVGDRKLNSSNIIAMLQTAYYFTQKEVYREKAFELMERHGYLENLLRPMDQIGRAENGDDQWADLLSQAWNHSDDEMYFLGYWGLYRYAFNDTLKIQYKKAILDHWEAERPEKDALWNIFTAMVQPKNFDLQESIWFLKKHPMDLISWNVGNSHRKDIIRVQDNFRKQSTEVVLPPSETVVAKHNSNRFRLDGGNDGMSEYSAGDIWLLPYWMGRYLGLIGE